MPTIRYTLRFKVDQTTVELANWVRSKMGDQLTLRDCLMVARALKNGEDWEPEFHLLQDPEAVGPCEFDITPDPDDSWAIRAKEQSKLWELCERGAAGDAEAAIAWCKAELEGKVSHGAIG